MERDLNDVLLYTLVAAEGSFSAAAQRLGLRTSSVSRRIRRLEERLGAQLLRRSPRGIALTDAGVAYYEQTAPFFKELDAVESSIASAANKHQGRVRATAPLDISGMRSVWLSFAETHPDIELDLLLTNRYVDIENEGFDVVLRAGLPKSSTTIVKKLGTYRLRIVAAPAYLDARGRPATPQDLKDHDVVFLHGKPTEAGLVHPPRKLFGVPVRGRLIVNDLETARQAALSAVALTVLPEYFCREDLRSGELEAILPDTMSPEVPLYMAYPERPWRPPAVTALLAHLRATVPRLCDGA